MGTESECDRIRGYFSPLLDGELDPETQAAVEEHLAECSACLRELDAYKKVTQLYLGQAHVSAPADFEEQLRNRLRPRKIRLRTERHTPRRWWPLAAAAAFLVFSAIVLIPRMHAPQRFELARSAVPVQGPLEEKLDARLMEMKEPAAPEPVSEPAPAPAAEAAEVPPVVAQNDRANEEAAGESGKEQTESLGYVASSRAPEPAPVEEAKPARAARPANPPPVVAKGKAKDKTKERVKTTAEDKAKNNVKEEAPTGGANPQAAAPAPQTAPQSAPQTTPQNPPQTTPVVTTAEDEWDSLPVGKKSQLPDLDGIDKKKPHARTKTKPVRAKDSDPKQAKPASVSAAKPSVTPDSSVSRTSVADRSFVYENGVWREERYKGEKTVVLFRESSRFETLRQTNPDIVKFAALGPEVIFFLNDLWYHIKNAPSQP